MGGRQEQQLAEPGVAFDPATHTYTLDGVVLPAVTDVLRDAGLIDTRWFTAEARDRGAYVHKCIELDEVGDLDYEEVVPGYQVFIDAWRLFKQESRAEILKNEFIVYDAVLAYAGTVDFLLTMNDRLGVLDVKTGDPLPFHALQLAAYARCVTRCQDRWTLHLKSDGRYKLHRHDDPIDELVFRSALNVVQWKHLKGMPCRP